MEASETGKKSRKQQPPSAPPQPTTLDAALELAEMGWSIIPLCSPTHEGNWNGHAGTNCKRPGKTPAVKWTDRQTTAFDAHELRILWEKNPFLNVGVVTGMVSGIVMVDIDTGEGEGEWFKMAGSDRTPTWEFGTGRGGRHLIYHWPHQHAPRGNPFKGLNGHLDFLGEGHQSVIPPSVHRNGSRYVWTIGGPGSGMPLAPVPVNLMEALRGPVGGESGPMIEPQECVSVRTLQRAAKWTANFEPAISGEGGSAVAFRLACSLIHGLGLTCSETLNMMSEYWNHKCVPPWSREELEHTIANAFDNGSFQKIEERPMTRINPPKPAAPAKVEESPFVSGEDVQEGEYKFFFHPYVPVGVPVFLVGHGGVGKSTFQAFLASKAKKTLFLPGEEDPGINILPRLKDLGVARNRWAHMEPCSNMTFPDCIDRFARAVKQGGFDLIIADPICDYVRLSGNGDPHNQIRDFLNAFRRMCMQIGVAAVLCRHPGKTAGNLMVGNRAWRNVPRVVIEMLEDPGPPMKYIIRCDKYQVGPFPPPRNYELLFPKDRPPRFKMGDPIEASNVDLAKDMDDRIERLKVVDAADFLAGVLANAEVETGQVYKQGEVERLSDRTLRRAAQRIGVITRRSGVGKEHKCFWRLPDAPVEPSAPQQTGGSGELGQSEWPESAYVDCPGKNDKV